jgi:hypothetical protein
MPKQSPEHAMAILSGLDASYMGRIMMQTQQLADSTFMQGLT